MTDLITAEILAGKNETIKSLMIQLQAMESHVKRTEAELAQARADAKAAVGLAIERAEVAAKNVATGFHDGISGDWHPYSGLTMINETCKAIRALAPEDAIAEVARMRAELEAFRAQKCS